MKRLIISYFDKKLGVYSDPFSVAECSNEDLIELTKRMCSNPKIPDVYFDYELFKLGDFDDKTGVLTFGDHPEYLCSLGDFRYLKSEVKDNECKS